MLRHSSNNMKKSARSAKGAMKRSGNIGLNKKNSSIRSTANQRLLWLQCSKLASRKPMSSTLSLGSLVYIYYGFLATDSPVDTGHGQPWPISEWSLCWRLPPELSQSYICGFVATPLATTTRLRHPPHHATLRILYQTTFSDLLHNIRSSMKKMCIKVLWLTRAIQTPRL